MKSKNKKTNVKEIIAAIVSVIVISLVTHYLERVDYGAEQQENNVASNVSSYANIENVPKYDNEIYVEINGNKPYFNESEYTKKGFEKYSELDSLGRCGVAYACICKETMPPEGDERGDISQVKPTGWKQAKFNGEFIYNRCHLIAYCLSDEDANEKNLITGTRYFNTKGMLTFEKKVLEYMNKNPKNHVLYRVTPHFEGNNLLSSGVEMEAYSIEDNGAGVSFNVYVYNVQPGANIDYATGKLLNN